jgi:hypothetical protein
MQANLHDYDEILAALKGIRRAYYVPVYDPYVTFAAAMFATAGTYVCVGLTDIRSRDERPTVCTRELVTGTYAQTVIHTCNCFPP